MSNEVKLSDVLLGAVGVVLSRDGDVSTDDGCFASVDIGSIINLESGISKFFDLDSDDVTFSNIPIIKAKLDKYDQLVEENKRLRQDVLFLARLKQHNEIDSHYRLNALVSMAASTLKELDGEK